MSMPLSLKTGTTSFKKKVGILIYLFLLTDRILIILFFVINCVFGLKSHVQVID